MWAAGLVLALLVLAGGALAGGVHLVKDVSALMTDRSSSSMVALARRWGLMTRVIVVVGPGEPGSDELLDRIDAAGKALEGTDGIGRVTWKVDAAAAREAAQRVMGSGSRLFRPDLDGLSVDDAAARLAALKERLASPEAMVIQEFLLADPLGFGRGSLQGLEAMGAAMGTTTERGRLLSADGRYGIVTGELDFDPMDVDRAAGFVSELDENLSRELGAHPGDGFFAIGGPHFAASSARTIISDISFAFALTGVGILLVFVLFFRRVLVLPMALVPGGVGILTALGVFGITGQEVHALTIGFAATITGISVDYAIHLLYRALHHETGTRRERMTRALGAVARPVILGCGTTVAAFLLVATSSFPGMRQLALFAVISIPTALGVTLLLMPAFHRLLLGAHPSRPGVADRAVSRLVVAGVEGGGLARKVLVIAVFAAVAAAAAVGISRVETTGDPRALGSVDEELERSRSRLDELFPGLTSQALIIASGGDMEEALAANDALYETLVQTGVPRGDIVSISPFLPSDRTQRTSLDAARGIMNDERMAGIFSAAGFSPGFYEELSKRPDPPAIEEGSYGDTPLGRMVFESVRREPSRVMILTRVKSDGDERLAMLTDLAGRVDGCAVISERLEASRALDRLQEELVFMLGVWFLSALVLLSLVRRSPTFGLRACVPAVFGLLCAAGIFGFLGRPVTPVAAAALTLVMGLGIDYGIFMQSDGGEDYRRVAPAVTASAFTTLAAFGVLVTAGTRAMADMGLIVLVGVGMSMMAALLLVPALGRRSARGGASQ